MNKNEVSRPARCRAPHPTRANMGVDCLLDAGHDGDHRCPGSTAYRNGGWSWSDGASTTAPMTIDGMNADVPMAASTTCHHTETVCVDCIDTWSIDHTVTVATVAYVARMDVVLRARATSDRMRAMNDRRVMRGMRPATRAYRTGAGRHAR